MKLKSNIIISILTNQRIKSIKNCFLIRGGFFLFVKRNFTGETSHQKTKAVHEYRGQNTYKSRVCSLDMERSSGRIGRGAEEMSCQNIG
jgi:hypothetical protein